MSLDMDLTRSRKIETIEARLKQLEDAIKVLSEGVGELDYRTTKGPLEDHNFIRIPIIE